MEHTDSSGRLLEQFNVHSRIRRIVGSHCRLRWQNSNLSLDVTAYAIDAISDTNTIIYPSGIDIVPYSSSQTVSYIAKNNCLLTSLIVDGNQESLNTHPNDYNFNSILANHTVQVISQPQTVDSPSPSPNQTVDNQTPTETLTASPTPAVSEFPVCHYPNFPCNSGSDFCVFQKAQRKGFGELEVYRLSIHDTQYLSICSRESVS